MKKQQKKITFNELIDYPEGSLGFGLGRKIAADRFDPNPVPETEDVFRFLLTDNNSAKEEIAMHCCLLGNGLISLYSITLIISGIVRYPLALAYFLKRYRDGKNALRFYDLDHFRMLHLPVKRIKDTFLIR